MTSPLLLSPSIQNYHWGKKGSLSFLATLISSPEPETLYAELWYGAHPSAPSKLHGKGESQSSSNLLEAIEKDPKSILGEAVSIRFDKRLPFLFKALSIGAPLSIQAHPDKALAKKLHRNDPAHYPDDNHKPEIAIAISELQLVYGFKSPSEIAKVIAEFPQFRALFGEKLSSELESAIPSSDRAALVKRAYQAIVTSSDEVQEKVVLNIENVIKEKKERSWFEETLLSLIATYGTSDIGIPTMLIMNALTIPPFSAIFVGPNIPHAYISGDIVECMATSDNVVRGGLTPKYKDLDTLVKMLDYTSGMPEIIKPTPVESDSTRAEYKTPAKEFSVEKISSPSKKEHQVTSTGVTLLVCFKGSAFLSVGQDSIPLKVGNGVIIPGADTHYSLQSEGESLIFRVSVP